MGKKRCIQLFESEELTLHEGVKNHPKYEFRRCCQALLWSHKGWSAKEIATALDLCQQTVGNWLTAWQAEGIVGIMRSKGQGRKPILSLTNKAHQQHLKQAVVAHYQDVERIKIDLQTAIGQPMSRDTVKRFLKKTITTGIVFGEQPSISKIL